VTVEEAADKADPVAVEPVEPVEHPAEAAAEVEAPTTTVMVATAAQVAAEK
jgi:hypothetical protein